MAWNMWEHCNGALLNSQQAQQNIVKSCVNDEICACYMVGTWDLPCNVMHLMKKPLEHQFALPFMTKQQWLESIALAIEQKS